MSNNLPPEDSQNPQNDQPRYCPECFHQMGRHGRIISGRKRIQRWLCSQCLRTTVNPLTANELIENQKAQQEKQKVKHLHEALASITKPRQEK